MSDLKRISGIDIDEDMDFQWREWRIQRIARSFFVVVLLAGLLGLLGQGPLAKAHLGEPNGPIALDYERIDRYGAPTNMTVLLGSEATQSGQAQVSFSREFMDRISVAEVIPEPNSVETGADAMTYTFEVKDGQQPVFIRLDFQHEQIGMAQGAVRLEGGPELSFRMFVWP